jgi:DNA polymerase-1
MMHPAELFLSRSLLGLVPCRHEGQDAVAVASLDDAAVLVLDARGLVLLTHHARRIDRVIVCDDAKAVQRWLLVRGIDIARPLCVQTVSALVRGEPWSPTDAVTLPGSDTALDTARHLVRGVDALLARLDGSGQKKVARLECLVTRAFAALEHRGLPIDVGLWRQLVADDKARMQAAREQVFALAGDHVPRDLFGVPDINLDAELEVKALIKRATGVTLESSGKQHLAAVGHPLADALVAYREPWKIVSTYGDSFVEHVADVRTDGDGRSMGRIRSTFVPLGASTGRVACREPNLQNLPKDARFHEALRAPAGRLLVTADYAACELRIVAELAEDPVFLAAFDRGEDLHSTVASSLFGVPVSKTVNPELRHRAKAINFGLVYGMGPGALATSLGVERGTGEDLLARYFKTFPRIRDYLDGSVETAMRRGYSETVLGRRLTFDPAALRADNARGELSRIMKNMPIQGTSADMTKLAMVRIHETLTQRMRAGSLGDAGIVNTVHDELVVECDAADGDVVAAVVGEEMSEAHRALLRRVPPSVEVHLGPTWHH